MTREAAFLLAAVAAGFVAGFLWGRETRGALSDATRTEFSGGVLTVKVDTFAAAKAGIQNALGGGT